MQEDHVLELQKKEIIRLCREVLDEQIARIETVMKKAQEEANLETKSSAGDKYETGRSMMQLEKEKYALQHQRISKQMVALSRIRTEKYDCTQEGSLVDTEIGWFFVGFGMGVVEVGKMRVQCISLETPMGKILEGSEEGDILVFRGREFEVFSVR
jgi:hypothetical protein